MEEDHLYFTVKFLKILDCMKLRGTTNLRISNNVTFCTAITAPKVRPMDILTITSCIIARTLKNPIQYIPGSGKENVLTCQHERDFVKAKPESSHMIAVTSFYFSGALHYEIQYTTLPKVKHHLRNLFFKAYFANCSMQRKNCTF